MQQQLVDKIQNLDLSSVMERVMRKVEDQELADTAEDMYRKYLTVRSMSDTPLVPPKLADIVMHEHIMDTRKYVTDCNEIFGDILHHLPLDACPERSAAWQKTREMFKQNFAVDPETVTVHGALMNGEGCCAA